MSVISVSLPQDLVDDMDHAVTQGDFAGRSEWMRAACRNYLQARPAQKQGHVHGSITILYPHDKEARLSDVRHTFHDVVLSLMHTHCEPETCMDVLVVGGPVARITQLQETLERMRDVRRTRLVLMT